MKNRLRGAALAATATLATAGVIAAGAAHAADLGVAVVKAPKPLYNWTGCYVGAFVGWGAANDWKSTDLKGFNPGGVVTADFSLGNEATGGGTLGCNWQANPWFVLGIEGEGGYLNVAGVAPQSFLGGGFSTVAYSAKVGSGYGLIAGRAGVAFDRLLIYGKIGVAFYDSSATVAAPGFVGATGSKSQSPLALGLGGEYAIYDHWTGKAEYVHFDRGSSFNVTGGGFSWKQDPSSVHTFKLGLNYKFW